MKRDWPSIIAAVFLFTIMGVFAAMIVWAFVMMIALSVGAS